MVRRRDLLGGVKRLAFVGAGLEAFYEEVGDLAAQAFALGVVIMECVRRAGSLEDQALPSAARGLDTTTLYGRFLLDR
jgi:hypothetical protein